MSYNAKQYLDYEERRLEPELQLRGTYRRWPELRKPEPELIKPMKRLSEEEDNKRQDEFLKRHGVC